MKTTIAGLFAACTVLHCDGLSANSYTQEVKHGTDRHMSTAIISAISAIIAALITASVTLFVTLRSKKIELLANSEERKAKTLELGYNTMLAAADLGWHYRCHNVLSYYGGIDPPFDWDKEFPKVRNRVEALFSRGIDLLKANSLHYESVMPSLHVLFTVIWNGQTVSKMEALPQDYEDARQLLIEMSRIDGRLTKPTKKNFWKNFFGRNKPMELHKLSAQDQIRRARAMLMDKQAETVVFQGDDALLEFIQSFQKYPPIYTASLVRTASRIEQWKDEGILKSEMPCDQISEHCYKEAQKRWPDFAETSEE